MHQHLPLEGFDPLSEATSAAAVEKALFEDATKRVVLNILRSYTGYYDVFSEIVQNCLDAIDEKRAREPNYRPKLNVFIDIADRSMRVIDNGIGMTLEQFKYCFRPNVSFKRRREGRGHKGVGATFLAYNYDHIRLQSKRDGDAFSATLSMGRHWAEDITGSVPRPTFKQSDFDCSALSSETSGTCVEIQLGPHRPNLSWLGATSAQQWYDVLRLKTPLGGIYLHSPDREVQLDGEIEVRDLAGTSTRQSFTRPDYYYPHDLPNIDRIKSVSEIEGRISSLAGDPSQRLQRLGEEFKRLDAVWDVWNNDQIVEHPVISRNLTDDQKVLIGRHRIYIYGCFMSTAKTWTSFQQEYLKIRKSPVLLSGGLQMASDFMIQGDPSVIPLTSTIGYQNNTHIVLHLIDGNPDMGRKVFQPEIKAVADELSRRVVDVFKSYLSLMRPDTGAPSARAGSELWNYKTAQISYREKNPLDFTFDSRKLSIVSVPQKEQDVVALFHELLGIGLLRGYRVHSTSEHERYDSVVRVAYEPGDRYAEENYLGVDQHELAGGEGEPKIIEYKVDLDGLIADFENEKKFVKDVDLLVCWTMGDDYKDSFTLTSYLWGEQGAATAFFGATHSLYRERERVLEIICLRDLLKFVQDPIALSGEQKVKYGN
jgi:hypothetical protein